MSYNVVHLLDNVSQVNYGVWNAALANSSVLAESGVSSYAFFPSGNDFIYNDVNCFPFNKPSEISIFLDDSKLNKSNTLIVSHGCWRWPSKMGYSLSKKGYKWMVVPHGMLEPWSLQQKKLKKRIYFYFIEKGLLGKAHVIRAVGRPEYLSLKRQFGSKVIHIANGINPNNRHFEKSSKEPINFLFMARLHHKKGVVPLIKGWMHSILANKDEYHLQIVGPDDGELAQIKPLLNACSNINYIGAVYGEDKVKLLENSHIYLLPSYSEGFPSSVLEAMDYGLLCLISKGCNFPEAFENNLVIPLEPSEAQIKETLSMLSTLALSEIIKRGMKSKSFVRDHYSNNSIGEALNKEYKTLLDL